MKKNIILVGLMGAGKSTIGRNLAKSLGKDFYDSDRVIEERTGVDIATIFEIEGEQGFRDREEQVIAELCEQNNIVLATGGGSVLRESNRKNMSKRGHVVYLRTSAELLYSRIRHDKKRPLMQTVNPLNTLKKLLDDREPYYLDISDTVVMTGKQKVAILVRRVEEALEQEKINK
ncbi:MAG: shikimate kinase AroK [Cocleimonas sp.]|nr:shikimate kinase AroK [Cocleimonas sp.]